MRYDAYIINACLNSVKTFEQYSDKMVKFYKKSVSFSALWVSTNDKLSDFYTSSWQRGESPATMLVVRAFLTACALAILTWSLVEGATAYWLIYLTNWGILLVMATTMTGLAVSFIFVCKRPCESTELPWYVSLYWVLFNIGVTMSVMITALYWILLYNPDVQPEKTRLFWLDVTTHGLTSCVVMAEFLFSRTPVRLPHIYQPLGVGLWYAVFTGIYYVAGGTDIKGNHFIYEVLDWQQSTRTGIVVIGSVAGLIVLYLTLWGVAFIRDKISSALVRTRSHDLPTIPSQQNSHMV